MGMSQKLPLGGFKWDEETSQFNEAFVKSYTDHIDEGCLFEVDFPYLANLYTFTMIYSFYLKEWKLEKLKNV